MRSTTLYACTRAPLTDLNSCATVLHSLQRLALLACPRQGDAVPIPKKGSRHNAGREFACGQPSGIAAGGQVQLTLPRILPLQA